MARSMTPSAERKPMTDGQLDKLVALYRDVLRKHKDELTSDAVQQVLASDDFVGEMVGVLRRRAEAVSDLIVRRVRPDRTRTPQQALKATGRQLYVTDSVVATMSHGDGEETYVYFFNLGRYVSNEDLEKEYELRGLKSADVYSLAAVNEGDPSFADDHPNGTHWKDGDGKWCYATFCRWGDGRYVFVNCSDYGWDDDWWFAGLRK